MSTRMDTYSAQEEAKRVLWASLLGDERLDHPVAFRNAAQKVKIVGNDTQPYLPTPCKITESSSSLSALVAIAASAVDRDRYGGEYQDIEVNTDMATLFLMSFLLPTVQGTPALYNPVLRAEMEKGDLFDMAKPIHRQCTNIYRTRDGRWYHLHGSMNATASMRMLGVAEQDVTHAEAMGIYAAKVAQWDSWELERAADEEYGQAGVVCNTPDEFLATEQGRIMAQEPLYTLKPVPTPRKAWPAPTNTKRPLEGIRVLDCSRVIAGPVVSKLLAALGAEVLKVSSSKLPDIVVTLPDLSAGKKDCDIDLKTAEGRETFRRLARGADVLIDGYRPGALEKLGVSPGVLRETNRALIYFRENCYGFKGPLAHRPGWQQISDCLVGLAWLQGKFLGLEEPVIPLLANSDYQMGLAGAAAIMQALYRRANEDLTFDVETSLTQYSIWYMRLGQYTEAQQAALLRRNEGFTARHYDEMSVMFLKTLEAARRVRPELFRTPEFFEEMDGRGWGLEGSMRILRVPFGMSGSELTCRVPSGSRGRSLPRWDGEVSDEQALGSSLP